MVETNAPAASATNVAAHGLRNATAANDGHANDSYDSTRSFDSVRGTSMPNSCGGAYWHAYRHSPQL